MNKEVKIKKGELLAVKLKSQPGTGYGWKLTDKWELVNISKRWVNRHLKRGRV